MDVAFPRLDINTANAVVVYCCVVYAGLTGFLLVCRRRSVFWVFYALLVVVLTLNLAGWGMMVALLMRR